MKVAIRSANGNALWAGTAPLQVQLTDAAGERVEFGGPVAAVKGIWQGKLRIAKNAPVGQWTLHVTHLADGSVSAAKFSIAKQ